MIRRDAEYWRNYQKEFRQRPENKAKAKAYQKARIAAETPAEREARLAKLRDYLKSRYVPKPREEAAVEKKDRKAVEAAYYERNREKIIAKASAYQAAKHAAETPAERAARLAKARAYQAERRAARLADKPPEVLAANWSALEAEKVARQAAMVLRRRAASAARHAAFLSRVKVASSLEEAWKRDLARYYGKPCPNCGGTIRYKSSRYCVDCSTGGQRWRGGGGSRR